MSSEIHRFSKAFDTSLLSIRTRSCHATRCGSSSEQWHIRSTGPLTTTQRSALAQGHGILQPRVAVSLPGTNHSRYARLWGGEPGIDPYTRAVSDVYQDVFGEGSFIGKGIYDVDVFEQALGGRFPENRILSHDLIEGCYARSGLLSDVQLYEDYPATYDADVARRHRWIRGDWQIAHWALPLGARSGTQSAEKSAVTALAMENR